MANNHKSGWALDSDQNIVHIADAHRGVHGYICPICHKELIAKKGEVNAHHFAHRETPDHPGESALHFVAKNLLASQINQSKSFDYKYKYEIKEYSQKYQTALNTVVDLRQFDVFGAIKLAETEKAFNEHITPDITVNLEEGRAYYIEIYVTSKKSKQRIKELRLLDVSVLEIDLSKLNFDAGEDEIQKALNNHNLQNWLYLADRDFPAREEAFKYSAEQSRRRRNAQAMKFAGLGTNERDYPEDDFGWLKEKTVKFFDNALGLLCSEAPPWIELTSKVSLVVTSVNKSSFVEVGHRVWKGEVLVNKKTWINCFITDQGELSRWMSVVDDNPVLIIYGLMPHDVHWENIESWRQMAIDKFGE